MAIAVVALSTIAPASAGNIPYSLCKISRTRTRSHPIGYTSGTVRTCTPSLQAAFTFSIKSGWDSLIHT